MFIGAPLRLLPSSVYCFSKSKTRRYFVYCAGLYPASSPPSGGWGLSSFPSRASLCELLPLQGAWGALIFPFCHIIVTASPPQGAGGSVHPFIRSSVHPLTLSLVHPLTRSFIFESECNERFFVRAPPAFL